MLEKIRTTLENIDLAQIFAEHVVPGLTKVAFAISIFIVGRFLARLAVKWIGKVMRQAKQDAMLVEFVTSILRWVLILAVVVTALSQIGLVATSFVTVLGAAGLAVALALKDSLGNLAAGVMMILFRPFKVGDFIEAAGTAGIVEEMRIFATKMRTLDNQELIVPNAEIYKGVIKNATARSTRRLDFVFGIGYDDDFRVAKQIIADIFAAESRLLKEPAPFIGVAELGESSVNIYARPWVKTEDYFQTKCDLLERIKLAFDEAGISIPYPQLGIHIDSEGAPTEVPN